MFVSHKQCLTNAYKSDSLNLVFVHFATVLFIKVIMKNRKKDMVLIVAGIVFVALIVYIVINLTPKARMLREITAVLNPVLKEENQSMKLQVNTNAGETAIQTDARLYMVTEEQKYLVVKIKEFPVYIADNLLVLKNGKAFEITEEAQKEKVDYKNLFLQIAAIYKAVDFECQEAGLEKTYLANVSEENLNHLLKYLPVEEVLSDRIEKIQLKLVKRDKKLNRIEFLAAAGTGEDTVNVSIILSDFKVLDKGEYLIPEAVRTTVETVERETLFNLSEDLQRLLKAGVSFLGKESVDGTLYLTANCGILNVNHVSSLKELSAGGSGSHTLGISVDVNAVTNFVALLCMEGDISCTGENGRFLYQLRLDRESMEILAQTIMPELVNYALDFTEGNAQIVLEGNAISSVKLEIQGTIDLLISKVPAKIGVEIEFNE